MDFKISIAGDLGSGKSTVADILSKKFGAEIISGGRIQRDLASKMGITIEQFNIFMENDRSYDKKLDDHLASYDSVGGNFIFDSRMSWFFIPSAKSFYLKSDPLVAAKRVFEASRKDEGFSSVEEAQKSLSSRRESEAKRYKEYYGQDILDMSNYDFVIDTTHLSPEEVAKKIEECYFK